MGGVGQAGTGRQALQHARHAPPQAVAAKRHPDLALKPRPKARGGQTRQGCGVLQTGKALGRSLQLLQNPSDARIGHGRLPQTQCGAGVRERWHTRQRPKPAAGRLHVLWREGLGTVTQRIEVQKQHGPLCAQVVQRL
ncbi:hypothetical protein GCM10023090_23140 [Acidovorax lacteus]|uniref:Uncharacterized protein n=1 Tax=Acidovorax lacteus TaxID=1924988 RepID=A0ABP8LD98_9BURK